VAGRADDLARLEVLADRIGVDLRGVAVAQQGERYVRRPQCPLAFAVLAGQRAGRVIGIEDARVPDARETPAVCAAVMTLRCWAASWLSSLLETSSRRFTPASAAPSVSGRE
jgi:hypothetical protein